MGSERKRERLNRPPRLALPVVDVDVLPDRGMGGAGKSSSANVEFLVEDLPLSRRIGAVKTGEDLPDRIDVVESLRDAKAIDEGRYALWDGDGRGDGNPLDPLAA